MAHPAGTSEPQAPGLPAVATEEDLLAVVRTDRRLEAYPVRATGPGFVELGLEDGSVVFAWPALWRDLDRLQPHLVRARSGYLPLVLLGTDADFTAASVHLLREQADLAAHVLPLGRERLAIVLENYRELCRIRRAAAQGELLTERYRYELDEINAIGRALSSERDIGRLLALILQKSRYVTSADAGSVFVVEGEDEDVSRRRLRFKVAQNDSVPLDLSESTLPVSPESIVGRTVLERKVINIPDLYTLDEPGTGNNPWGFQHNRQVDGQLGYQTHSVLSVPMIDAEDQVIGVIQLINKKRRPDVALASAEDFARYVLPFDSRSQDLAATLASQAAISLENTQLYDDIQQLFEGFVRASVLAIESRDPTTSGHSQRVAALTVGLAQAAARLDSGPYRGFELTRDQLKQIEYAALLHDFGKVGVREHVLVKARKLHEAERDLIVARFDFIRKSLQMEYTERKLRCAIEAPRDELRQLLDRHDAELAERLREIDDCVAFILRANQPTVLDQGGFERLAEIAQRTYHDATGNEQPYLTPREVKTLQILRGSLTPEERAEIESHVTHTFNFLRRIPWGRAFRDIPDIAVAHHEKLDGTGYPRRVAAPDIPAPAKMMTIADIFDALTASDRPYKAAVPVTKALDIIADDVKRGKLDPDLFRVFVEGKIYELVIRH